MVKIITCQIPYWDWDFESTTIHAHPSLLRAGVRHTKLSVLVKYHFALASVDSTVTSSIIILIIMMLAALFKHQG